tara:strand:+ start:372 stop:656 length:285 start_codon:yes stop_codon:yes gene_type:complete
MKVRDIVSQIERMFGRQPNRYVNRLINDAISEIAAKRQHRVEHKKIDLVKDQRWYDLDTEIIDVVKVEIKDTNDRYVMVPKLADSHRLLKEDEI